MKYVKEAGTIFGMSAAGEILNKLLPLPVPAGVYGLFLLLICRFSTADSSKLPMAFCTCSDRGGTCGFSGVRTTAKAGVTHSFSIMTGCGCREPVLTLFGMG